MAIDVETVGGSTGTNAAQYDSYFYDSFDYETAKVNVTYKATGYDKEENLLWFYLSGDAGVAEDTPFAYASLNDPARTEIVDMTNIQLVSFKQSSQIKVAPLYLLPLVVQIHLQ